MSNTITNLLLYWDWNTNFNMYFLFELWFHLQNGIVFLIIYCIDIYFKSVLTTCIKCYIVKISIMPVHSAIGSFNRMMTNCLSDIAKMCKKYFSYMPHNFIHLRSVIAEKGGFWLLKSYWQAIYAELTFCWIMFASTIQVSSSLT